MPLSIVIRIVSWLHRIVPALIYLMLLCIHEDQLKHRWSSPSFWKMRRQVSIKEAIQVIIDQNPGWKPTNFMTDFDEEISALEEAFTGSTGSVNHAVNSFIHHAWALTQRISQPSTYIGSGCQLLQLPMETLGLILKEVVLVYGDVAYGPLVLDDAPDPYGIDETISVPIPLHRRTVTASSPM